MNHHDQQLIDQICQQRNGKPFSQCNATELQATLQSMHDEITSKQAAIERCQAAQAEAANCGCTVLIPTTNRRWDIGRARVRHTCKPE